MLEAFAWGAVASGTLLLGAMLAYLFRPGPGLNAVIMAAGAGLLLGSVSYDLVEEALGAAGFLWVALWFFAGSAIFVLGDVLLDRMGARKPEKPLRRTGRWLRTWHRDGVGTGRYPGIFCAWSHCCLLYTSDAADE